MNRPLRSRLFGTSSDAWHHENYVYVGGPVLAVVGVLVGVAITLPLSLSPLQELLLSAGCALLSTSIGLAVLALIDVEQDPTLS